jgi:UrcA family protein
MNCRLCLLIAGLLAAAGLGPVVHARPDVRTVQVRVSSAGLDLTTEAGAGVYLKRLARAATAACGGQPDHSPLVFASEKRFQACRTRALADVVARSPPIVQRHYAAAQDGVRLAKN